MSKKKVNSKDTIIVLKPTVDRANESGDSIKQPSRPPKLVIGYHCLNLEELQKNRLESLRNKVENFDRFPYISKVEIIDEDNKSPADIFDITDVNDLVNTSKEYHSVTKIELTNQQLSTIPGDVWKASRISGISEDRSIKTKPTDTLPLLCLTGTVEQGPIRVLDLSCNYLKQISCEIKNLPSLQILNLSNNQLTLLPMEISELNELEEIHLCYNLFQHLPKILYKLHNLKLLFIKCNYISTVDKELKYLNQLQLLDLSQNNLYSWPYPVLNSKTIVELNLTNNKISLIPDQIHNMKNLKFLRLRWNHIRRLPKMNKMTSLECIELGNNSIQIFPDFYGSIHLREIWLDHNLIQKMDSSCLVGTSTNLLSLSSNKLNEITGNVSLIDTLAYVDFSNNNLKTIPSELSKLEKLSLIKLQGNNFDDPNIMIYHKLGIKYLMNYLLDCCDVEKLNYSIPSGPRYMVVDHFDPKDVIRYEYLQPCIKLTVDNTGHLPNWMFRKAEHDEVMRLDLSESQHVQLPSQLWKTAPYLEELFLGHNCLVKLPMFIGHFLKLRVLDLESNNLTSLPQELAYCSELYYLNISYNKFSKLPPVIYGLKKLHILKARRNKIMEITNGLEVLKSLKKLDVSRNHITASQT